MESPVFIWAIIKLSPPAGQMDDPREVGHRYTTQTLGGLLSCYLSGASSE
jgi:hypothetical protein